MQEEELAGLGDWRHSTMVPMAQLYIRPITIVDVEPLKRRRGEDNRFRTKDRGSQPTCSRFESLHH